MSKDRKVLLVIGASSDVGSAFIRKTAEHYDKIIAHYGRSETVISALQSEIGSKIIPIQANLSMPESIENMLEKINREGIMPDHIVHLGAPKAYNQRFEKDSLENFSTALDVSVKSIIHILHSLIMHMKKQKYGKVVFMLSSYVLSCPPKYQTSYVMSKYALLGLMKSLSSEYADKGITVNAVSPDMMETKFLSQVPELIVQKNAESNPLGRNIRVTDVIPAFEYLLSDDADAVNGVNVPITGGKV